MAKILAVNWRDLRNPEAGGAEVHLHEILTRLVRKGHSVTLLATAFPGGAPEETYDGIRTIRRGSWYNANYVLALAARRLTKEENFDLVVEDINKIPFFLPLYVKPPVLPVIPHLFGPTVFRETNPVFATYVYLWERLIPWVYRKCRFNVISPSTKADLIRRGVRADQIDVVLCGLDHATYRHDGDAARFETPTLIHFGRVRKYKSVDVVIKAFRRVREELPDARLIVVGDGPERANLEALSETLGLKDSVSFTGMVPTEELVATLNRVHVFLNASPKEGWGLTVVEANACGVPVVASDRPGLQDSVLDNRTGFLVEYGDDAAFADRSLQLLRDPELWARMSAAGLEWAATLTWDTAADGFERSCEAVLGTGRA